MVLIVVLRAPDIDADDSGASGNGGTITAAAGGGGALTTAAGDGGVGKTRLDQKGSDSPLPLTDEEEEEEEVMEVDGEDEDECDCIGLRLLRAADAAMWSWACRVAKRGARHCWRREAGTCFFVAAAKAAPFLPWSTT
eukprot:evm.model.NODE_24622_length_62854_cov_30.334282.5